MASSRSTAPRRLRPRAGVAALSAVALAVGALGAFPHSIFAPQPAAAATLTGGIRGANGEGVVEKDAQKASDLPAGSCTLKGASGEGSQAGFSWAIYEPAAERADKRSFGVELTFDGSQDRTFNDWVVRGTNAKAGEYAVKGEYPALGPNDQNPLRTSKPPTDKADEVLSVAKTGRQPWTATIAPELSSEKIAQYAEATAEEPVRYLWAARYSQDNPHSDTQLFRNTDVSATVNPWPSENVDCNPITVTWEDITKHVIVPGEETKVGHINVPKPAEGADDSLSRIVVEANDGVGKFLGTSDTAASGGGEKLLRVDENGDIFYTWPAYRDADNADQMKEQREIAGQQNVNFSVIAKPRTVDQLENAAVQRNNGGAFAVVSDESNSLTRYNTPNVIDSKAFSLDDTMYHDPKYDKADATIISGVEGPKGPLAEARQSVTFTQVPDKIADLIKKKADGGQEATVALDETYVYDGWDVALDPTTHNVTVTAPENPVPGTFAQPRVIVTYSNGSKDMIPLLVVIDPNNTQVTDLVNPGMTKGAPNTSLTSQITTKPVMKGKKAVAPAKFEVDPSTVPSGWTVTVDEKGNVTAKADDTVPSGTVITPKVTATYPDQTTDEIKVQFQVVENIKVPEYPTVTGTNGDKVSLPVSVPEKGLSGSADDAAPTRYTFEDGSLTYTNGDWTVTIDENTGELTSTIPASAEEGDTLDVPVLAHYGDGVKPQKVTGTIAVIADGAIPSYSVESTSPNTAVTHKIDGAPKGSTFSFGIKDGQPVTEQEVDGWKYTIDPKTGDVTATPPASAKPGDKKTVAVTVNRPDGSTPKVPVTTVVKLSNNWEAEPSYPVETVYPGETAKLPVALDKPDNVNVAKENPYKLGDVPADWKVSIDDNGQVTATAPADAKPGDQVKIPVTVTYEDGSTDTAYAVVNVIDVPTREVPFKVEYKYDDTIPAGEYKVKTKGEPGSEKQNKDGSWEQTKAPVNEVVVIGTKPAASTKDVTWKVPIPFPTEVRENPELKPGETRVVQEGENGEKTYTAKFTAEGGDAQVAEEETTKEPKPRIIEYGPGLAPSELVTKTEKPIPFPTKVVFDDTLAEGEQVIDQQGELGTEVETSTQKLVDGKPSGEPTVTTERTKEPTEQIIRVGTKTAGETKKTVESEVPFGVKIEFDPNMPAGTSEVVTEGKPGKKTTTVTQKVTNSQPDGEATVEEKVTEEPVDQVVKVGTKPSEASEKVTWTAQVPFEVETRPNPELKPGEIKVVQKGVPGEKTYTADFTATGDQATVTPEEKQTKDPVNEIIEYGPAAEDTTVVTKTEKPVPFETEIVFDDKLEAGKQVVDKQGENGTEVVTSTQKIVDGKPSGDPEVTTERTKEPVKQIIRVGTMTTGETSKSVETEVPFGVKVEYDPTMPAGESKTVTEGKPGKKTVTVTQKVTNSKPDGEATVEEKVTEEPVDQVIKVGIKPAENTEKAEWTVPVPYSTTVRVNPDLAPGETRVVQKGENGEKSFTAIFRSVGDESYVAEGETTKEPVEEIIEYGPQAEDTSVVTKTEKPVPFETEIVFDDSLKAGEQVVDKQGENGTEVVTSTQKIVDGKPSGDPTVTTERTKEPTNAVIRVGTKTEGTNTTESEVEVPFETEIQFDDSMPAGTQETVQEGKPGKDKVTTTQTIENSKVTGTTTETERIAEPVKKIIKVGTKGDTTSKTVEWTESTPFEVEVRENPKLKAGETKVVQEGKPGEVKHTVTVTSDNGEITTDDSTETVSEPTKQIIEVGTAPSQTELTDRHTEQLPFETIIEADPNLESGKVVEDQAGAYGEKEVTKVWKLKDGVAVGDPETTENVTKEPTPRKLRVGTKTAGTNTETFETEVPFGVKVVYDPNMPAGESKVTTEGKPGKKTVTITREIVNSKPGDPEISEEITEQPVDQVITVGTKPGKATDELTWTTAVGYETIMRPNPDLAPGEVKVVQEGEFGEKTITVKFDATIEEGGIPNVSTRSDVTTKDPKPRIVEYGPRAKDTSVVTKIDRPIPFETEIITDDTLESGTQVIDQKGENGVEVVTSTQKIVDGKPSGDPEVTTERTKEPVKQIIRIGTKCDCDNPTPGEDPTPAPGEDPSDDPTTEPTPDPTDDPSTDPTDDPTTDPTEEPTPAPTDEPTTDPTDDPTTDPTEEPTPAPTDEPTTDPTDDPTTDPTDDPTTDPTEEPTPAPTDDPAPVDPTDDPSVEPGTPGTPDEPGTPDQPGTPEKPTDQGGTPDQPGTPEKPADQGGTPDQPGTPEKPADQGGTPDQPGTPEKPADQGGTPDKQDRPEASSPLPLPRTGAEIAATAGIAALLVLGGVGVLALRRKSRSQR
ncbi:G5 domain-containing protein [Dermabacter sp. HSID17554]|uniref:G5 domain-containing protein n=1 Tax=Dermabacter sp. HSID17554 TaxID=2419511 RepID=UPI000F85DE23|nr:G5 domain-containing protein [Dermabacter sp. HSID17554]RUP85798.1 cell surface protein [Dermabacter sp. HSID17554]